MIWAYHGMQELPEMRQAVEKIGELGTLFDGIGTDCAAARKKAYELTECICEDTAREGRNLIAEKYGRMMKYTEPRYYEEQIKPYIPALSAHAEQMIEEIIAIIVPWEAEFAKRYPKLGRVSRPVTAEGDKSGFTSMETYARGELGTYSEELLAMYLDYMKVLKEEGKSISVMDREVMTKLYGYDSIEAAENSL